MVYTEKDIKNAFAAGLNRGVYVASIIMKVTPIDIYYAPYEEYIEELLRDLNPEQNEEE